MGTYLSTPIVEKGQEEGVDSELAWGVVDMQGWRKSMEDAHVAQTDATFSDGQHTAKVFGVFDGHGGPEVARFCQLYLVDVLAKQDVWGKQEGLTTDSSQNAASAKNDFAKSPVGRALIEAFHALDRMIDDKARRDELIRLRTEKPQPGERRTTDSIPIPAPRKVQSFEPVKLSPPKDLSPLLADEPKQSLPESKDQEQQTPSENSKEAVDQPAENSAEKPEDEKSEDVPIEPEPSASLESPKDEPSPDAEESHESPENMVTDSSMVSKEEKVGEPESSEDGAGEDGSLDDDSQEPVGKEEAAELDQNIEDDDDTEMTDETTNIQGPEQQRGVTKMLNKFMKMGSKGQVVVTLTGVDTSAAAKQAPSSPGTPTSPTRGAIVPTIIRNGRQMCNLPEHPIHAGCTAVVAVKLGNTLTVANAGDSRAVLCRNGGVAEALSYDHKPQQEREMNRITNAGGFVNQFGRVNGNLNLSRSIGDLKYKQLPGLTPAEQMITAEPDILTVSVDPSDEFMILGCDGIWDCLTNDEAVKYVRDRIDSKSPTEIGAMLLDEIISEDPRHSQGIGGDNMTIMIVDFLPKSRTYR